MSNSKTLFEDFLSRIQLNESRDEILAIARIIFEDFLSISQTDLLSGKVIEVAPEKVKRLDDMLNRINTGEPVQYVLGHASFYGRKFSVNPSVLIPRPETEELVSQVLQHSPIQSILDIGTGSGCIPITVACEKPMTSVYATDISLAALSIAARNAASFQAKVEFWQHDILRDEIPFTKLDVIVSNPPYVADSERQQMKRQVLDHEPHLALFVSDADPLLFYRVISAKAKLALRAGGAVMFEVNERYGNEVAALIGANDYRNVQVIKDVSGKERIVKGVVGYSQ